MKNTIQRNREMILRNGILWAVLLLLHSCGDAEQPKGESGRTVSDVTNDAVTRIYAEGREDLFADFTQADILEEFSKEDLQVFATQYLVFRINQEARVFVCRDKKQEEVPFWLPESGFELTGYEVKNEQDTYEVWEKIFPAGPVNLGITGFDRNRPVYFAGVKALKEDKPLEVEPIYPEKQRIHELKKGSFTYYDWDELVITDLPAEMEGGLLLVTNRGRSREAHLIDAFRKTDFPSSDTVDQILLTWSGDPKTSVTLGWRTSVETEQSTLTYWEQGGKDTLTEEPTPERLEDRMLSNDRYTHRFRSYLTGLKPGTVYEYRISTPVFTSDTYSFRTDDGGSRFEFGWFGDVHNHPDWGKLLREGDRRFENIRFYLQSGDLVNTGLFRDDWDRTIGYSGSVFRHKPFMATPGNHDAQEGLPPTRYLEFLKYPSNGPEDKTPGLTYTFSYGNSQFFMMDCVSSPVEDQAAWLEEQLSQSEATFKIAAFHFSPFTPHEDYQDIKGSWVPLFEKYGVDLVLTGHFHYYQRTKAYGADLDETGTPTYIMSVGTTYKNKERTTPEEHEIVYFKNHLFPHFTVDGNRLELVTYDRNFQEIDRYVIQK